MEVRINYYSGTKVDVRDGLSYWSIIPLAVTQAQVAAGRFIL